MSSYKEWGRWSAAQRSAYCDRVARDTYDHCCSILIGCPHRPTSNASSGSGILVAIDDYYYVLTANHVVEGLAAKRRTGEPAHFQIGSMNVDPVARSVYADVEHDVAALAIDASEVRHVARRPYHPVGNWPPPLPSEGACVLLSGFAARNRMNREQGTIEVMSLHVTSRVGRPRDNHFYAKIERDGTPTENLHLMPEFGESLAGMSGGPAMMFTEGALPLVGIISEGFQMLDAVRVAALCDIRLPRRSTTFLP